MAGHTGTDGATLIRRRARAVVLAAHGARGDALDALLAYNDSRFDVAAMSPRVTLPLPDEPFVPTWESYADEGRRRGAGDVLRHRLLQLRFPIERGIGDSPVYRQATRRGVAAAAPPAAPPLATVEIFVHPSAAGRIPVVVAGDRAEFVVLVQALTRRNEPHPVPPSMGACMVAGYVNWDRVSRLRRAYDAQVGGCAWDRVFACLAPIKSLYQDRFILLARGPYSGVSASAVGLPPELWLELSHRIRLEHECAHYFTRRLFGSMRNALLDELIADYAGIVAAHGRFRADWFLTFLGLEGRTRREGGRLENYRGTPPLSPAAFEVLQSIVRTAAAHLERFDASRRRVPGPEAVDRAVALASLSSFTLEEIAAADACDALARTFATMADRFATAPPLVDGAVA